MGSGQSSYASRSTMARALSVHDEIRQTNEACEIASQQIVDSITVQSVERALEALSNTIESYGTIWLCGSGHGFCLAVEIAQKLATPVTRYERPTRASVLGLNGAITSTSYGKCGAEDALANELMVCARKNDALWCLASDSSISSVLNAAALARDKLNIPVVTFTDRPGSPLIRFSNVKVRIQRDDERDLSGYCVQWAHSFLANVMCSQLKRLARKFQV